MILHTKIDCFLLKVISNILQLNRLIEKNYGNGNSKYIDDINIRYKHPDHGSEKAKSQGLKRKRGRIYCIEKKKKKKGGIFNSS